MFQIGGIIFVFATVFGGYVLAGSTLPVTLQLPNLTVTRYLAGLRGTAAGERSPGEGGTASYAEEPEEEYDYDDA